MWPVLNAGSWIVLGTGVVLLVWLFLLPTVGRTRMRAQRGGPRMLDLRPPVGLSPLLVAVTSGLPSLGVVSEVLYLIQVGAISVETSEVAPGKAKSAHFRLRLKDPGRATLPLDQESLRFLFPFLEPGSVLELKPRDPDLARRSSQLEKDAKAEATRMGLLQARGASLSKLLAWGVLACAVAAAVILVLASVQLETQQAPVPGHTLPVSITSMILFTMLGIIMVAATPFEKLTHKGAQVFDWAVNVARLMLLPPEKMRAEFFAPQTEWGTRVRNKQTAVETAERLLPQSVIRDTPRKWVGFVQALYVDRGCGADWFPGIAPAQFEDYFEALRKAIQEARREPVDD